MKKDNKKALYESIMISVAKEVKKVLTEDTKYKDMHKFRVIRYTDKQLKNYDSEDYSGEDYVRCFVFDANERFLPDFTPDWLYDILNNIDYMEFEESIFEMREKSYNYLINHPDCVEHRYATNAEAYGNGEEYDENEYGEDNEDYNNYDDKDYDDYNSDEDYDNLILNNEFNVGDKVILTEKAKEFCKKLNFSWWNDKDFDKIYTIRKIYDTSGKKEYQLEELWGVAWSGNDLKPAV